ncbi:hypothetical protein KR222_005365 [Zaprionus bogoriensis]|nr:hypothetical protein KR222_005365 [Zaprionus bogoriensis]
MSTAETICQQCVFYAMAGLMGFVCGAYCQQEISLHQLFCIIRKDPYVFHYRHKIYPILSTFKSNHEARLWKHSMSPLDRIRNGFLFSISDVFSSLFLYKKAPSNAPDLLEMVKFGLPSSENLYVHKDYIVSQDLSANAPKWMCEHLKGNYKRLTSDNQEDALHLRYNDVFVLTNGGTRISKVFKLEIWRQLEQHVSQVTEQFGSVYVYTGPMYLPTCQVDKNWTIDYEIVDWKPFPKPSYYFKVLIIDPQTPGSAPFMEGYMIENKMNTSGRSCDLTDYLCDIAEIERGTGLRFYDGVQSIVRFDKAEY